LDEIASLGGLHPFSQDGILAGMNDCSSQVMLSEPAVPAAEHRKLPSFKNAARVQESFLARLEKTTLLWLAARMPAWVNSDHLTLLGFASLIGAGITYRFARWDRLWLLGAIVFLALNWFGDSVDGTLARFRNRQRPRYGFYVDHVVDAVGTFFLLGGMALSGIMSASVAIGLLIVYLLLMIEVCLATYTIGVFQISFFRMSPTELRIALSIGNLFALANPWGHLFGRTFLLFDVGGVIGIVGTGFILVWSVIRNTRTLYVQEQLP
jgi:archaetidylinositol phosphate synthase